LLATLGALLPFPAVADTDDYAVTVATLACDGTKGFALIPVDRIVRIEGALCRDGDPVAEVYKATVESGADPQSAYRVFTMGEEEARRLMEKTAAWQEKKKESLEKSDRIIIEKR
jgi:hypothetical protein